MIRLTVPPIDEEDVTAVAEVLRSGFLVQGARVAEFESVVAGHVGTGHAVAVSNGTAALLLTLQALGVGPGDRVAIPAYSWPATANAVVLCGAEPVFIDIETCTFNLDPEALSKRLEHSSVKAIMPVHTFGGMADMERVLAVAERYGVPVIEDAACALGAELHGRRAGAWGVAGCFSFHPRKVITTGEGGMVTTDVPSLARAIRVLRNHGLDPEASSPEFVAPGYNLRLTEFQGALGISQMRKIERLAENRRMLAARYDELLAGTAITPPGKLDSSLHAYQSYVALLPRQVAAKRTQIIARLKERGVETTLGTYHIPLTQYYRMRGGFQPGDFPVTDDVAARALSLPLFRTLQMDQQKFIVGALEQLIAPGCACWV